LPDPVSPVINTDAEDGETCLQNPHDILHGLRSADQVAESSRVAQLACQRLHLAGDPNAAHRAVPARSATPGRLEWFLDIPRMRPASIAAMTRSSLPLPVI